VQLYGTYFRLHGKSYDYKIMYSSVARITTLTKPDERHHISIVRLRATDRCLDALLSLC